jgi:hypothetical protein
MGGGLESRCAGRVYGADGVGVNTDLVHVNGHDRISLVIFSQALYKTP